MGKFVLIGAINLAPDQDEANLLSPVKPMMSKFVLIGAMNLAPD